MGNDTSKRKEVVALYDYKALSNSDISFRKGDKFYIKNDSDSEWWKAVSVSTKEKGYIPRNHIAFVNTLETEDWYFGKIPRMKVESLLTDNKNPKGTFLIRMRDTLDKSVPYCLSIKDWSDRNGTEILHYIIHLDENEQYFIRSSTLCNNLQDLVRHYADSADGLCCALAMACPKPSPQIWDLSSQTKNHWEIERSDIDRGAEIGHGNFGVVFKGVWKKERSVAIKELKSAGDNDARKEFQEELNIMKKLRHEHIVCLFGACTTSDPCWIVTEFMKNGSLLDHLKREESSLHVLILFSMATQVASGMKYLESKQYVHRDLAARNVLVDDNNLVKITDFGLTRLLQDEIYNAKGGQIPVRWSAPEAVMKRNYTNKSDVWSFAVLLWEILTLGGIPYYYLQQNRDVMPHLLSGERLDQPENCPKDLYDFMLQCWQLDPEKRPTFETVHFTLEDILREMEHQYR